MDLATLQWPAALLLAYLFGTAAAHKLTAGARFHAQLAAYELLPAWLVAPAAAGLVGVEAALCVALFFPPAWPMAAPVAAGLLALYLAAMAINLARGRTFIDCGCGDKPQPLSVYLLVRNSALVAAALVLAPGLEQFQWQPLLLGIPSALALTMLYVAFEQLQANASSLNEWVSNR